MHVCVEKQCLQWQPVGRPYKPGPVFFQRIPRPLFQRNTPDPCFRFIFIFCCGFNDEKTWRSKKHNPEIGISKAGRISPKAALWFYLALNQSTHFSNRPVLWLIVLLRWLVCISLWRRYCEFIILNKQGVQGVSNWAFYTPFLENTGKHSRAWKLDHIFGSRRDGAHLFFPVGERNTV